jgi:two-component system, NtrC family, response regulator PilR
MSQNVDADILIVDDEPDLRELYMLSLVHEGYACDAAGSVSEARSLLGSRNYRALIVDMRLPDGTGLDILRDMQMMKRSERVIVATAYGSADNAVEALKAGAYDYLSKPVDVRQLRIVIRSALAGTAPKSISSSTPATVNDPQSLPRIEPAATTLAASTQPNKAISSHQLEPAQQLIGESAVMMKLRDFIRRVAPSMAPVLIRGESGTGKELTARALHEGRARLLPLTAAPFRKNCWRRSFSATAKARLRVPIVIVKASSRRLRVAHFFSMKWPSCRWLCRPNYCVLCRSDAFVCWAKVQSNL